MNFSAVATGHMGTWEVWHLGTWELGHLGSPERNDSSPHPTTSAHHPAGGRHQAKLWRLKKRNWLWIEEGWNEERCKREVVGEDQDQVAEFGWVRDCASPPPPLASLPS